MEQNELERFKEKLKTMLAELKQPLGRRDEISVENLPDALDQVQRAADRELAIRKLESDSSRLRDLMNALRRIQEGTYGTCQRCEGEMSVKRLNAVPWTPYCLECQSIVDQDDTQAFKPALIRFGGGAGDSE